jgi:NAD(P)-dependent dehydrogenase (short-subunit alcohol dehydrogenase family)
MRVLLIGATGTIGKAINELLTAEGHEVIAVSRKSSPPVDIEKTDDLKTFLKDMDPVDHIICTAGRVHFGGSLNEITDDEFCLGIHSKLMGQVNVVRFGHAKVTGSILLTGGMLAYKPLFPNASQVGLVNSALNGFVICAGSDLKEMGVRVNVIHPPLIKETAVVSGMSGEGLPSAQEAARVYVDYLFKETGTGQEFLFPGFEK